MMRVAAAIMVLVSSVLLAGAAQASQSVDVIAAMIEAAAPGDVIEVPAGTYTGNLRIGKSVMLEGHNEVVLDGCGEGTVVEISAANVTLTGFTIRGSGSKVSGEPAGVRAVMGPVVIENCRFEDVLFGIDLRSSPGSIVRNNTLAGYEFEPGRRGDGIRLWWSHGCVVEDNSVRAMRDMVFWYSEDLLIARNRVEQSRYGLHFMYSHNTTLVENVLQNNSVGIYLMYSNNITLRDNTLAENRGASGYGIGLKDCDNITVQGNSILANRVGAYIDNSPSSVDAFGVFKNNYVAFNETGMLMTPITHDVVLTGNGFVENEEQVAVHGRGDLTLNTYSKDGRGNYWSDYAGFDADADSIGDMPYVSASLFASLLAREPNLRLFVHSPAQQAIEFTARALPQMRPDPKFVDPSPLMTPPSPTTASVLPTRPAMMYTIAAGLVGAAVVLLGWVGHLPSLAQSITEQCA